MAEVVTKVTVCKTKTWTTTSRTTWWGKGKTLITDTTLVFSKINLATWTRCKVTRTWIRWTICSRFRIGRTCKIAIHFPVKGKTRTLTRTFKVKTWTSTVTWTECRRWMIEARWEATNLEQVSVVTSVTKLITFRVKLISRDLSHLVMPLRVGTKISNLTLSKMCLGVESSQLTEEIALTMTSDLELVIRDKIKFNKRMKHENHSRQAYQMKSLQKQ